MAVNEHNEGFMMWDEASTRIGNGEVAYNQIALMMDKEETDKYAIKYNALVFKCNNGQFNLKIVVTNKTPQLWDGILEYSVDGENWTEIDKTNLSSSIISSSNNILFIRGKDNTRINANFNLKTVNDGAKISCSGDIRYLLNWQYFAGLSNIEPEMGANCFYYLFNNCTSLIIPPELPSINLSEYCYAYMFYGCKSLMIAPKLPATVLANFCYSYMFQNCSSLDYAPELPATELASNCYEYMFAGCSSFRYSPNLPTTILASYCYRYMFYNCVNLIKAPELPAKILTNYCYFRMFSNCKTLNYPPKLPATELATCCYNNMFNGCTLLKEAPELPATVLKNLCYTGMFMNCTSLKIPPKLPATQLSTNCYINMFNGCTSLSTLPLLPAIKLIANCYNSMFKGCSSIKVSETKIDEYKFSYRIPRLNEGSGPVTATTNMFINTGGSFTGRPIINTTYYTTSRPI